MKKLFGLCTILFACDREERVIIEMAPLEPTPTTSSTVPNTAPTPISKKQLVSDMFELTVVHEFGHAIGLLHPFDSGSYGEECRVKLRALGIEDNELSKIMREDYPEFYDKWDYNGDTYKYDESSIMQYSWCRSGYTYNPNPSPQDIVEASALLKTFRGRSFSLALPIIPDTYNFFRREADVPVCLIGGNSFQRNSLSKLINQAAKAWGKAGWEIHLESSCSNSYKEVRLKITTFPVSQSGLFKGGESKLGLFGWQDKTNMEIAYPESVQDLESL